MLSSIVKRWLGLLAYESEPDGMDGMEWDGWDGQD